MNDKLLRTLAGGALLLLAAACGDAGAAPRAEADEHRPVHVDSIFPIEEELRRFRATLAEQPAELANASTSRDALVERFVRALEARDEAALSRMALTRAEFAYLYYPFTRYTSRPYELSPAIVWSQTENHSGRGIGRALQRYGGRPLGPFGYRCDAEPQQEGQNRIWTDCVVELTGADGAPQTVQLLGPILEREGAFKFLSFANRL